MMNRRRKGVIDKSTTRKFKWIGTGAQAVGLVFPFSLLPFLFVYCPPQCYLPELQVISMARGKFPKASVFNTLF
jgi:hypothetical protein